MKAIIAVALLFAGSAQAQSYRQFYDELFCHDVGSYAYTALADYRDGMPEDASLSKIDGYLCTDQATQICDAKRDTLRKGARLIYEDMGPKLQVRRMSASQFLQFNDVNRAQAVSSCMSVVRNRP